MLFRERCTCVLLVFLISPRWHGHGTGGAATPLPPPRPSHVHATPVSPPRPAPEVPQAAGEAGVGVYLQAEVHEHLLAARHRLAVQAARLVHQLALGGGRGIGRKKVRRVQGGRVGPLQLGVARAGLRQGSGGQARRGGMDAAWWRRGGRTDSAC